MSIILRQSTQRVVRVGPFVDVTDGVTPETGITLGAADQAEALKAAGAATVDISGATWAAVTGADGWYDLTLTTSHTDTVGELVVVVQDQSVCLPVYQKFYVIEEAVYDAIFAASAAGYQVPIWSSASATVNLSATTVATVASVSALAAGSITASVIATGAIDADALAADAGTEIGGAVLSALGTGTWATAIPWNASWDAEVQSEVQDAIEANNLDHIAGTATGIPSVVAGTYLGQIMDDGTAAYDRTTDSLQALRDRGDSAWTTVAASAIRTAVGLASANLDTQLSTIDDFLDTEIAAIKAKTDNLPASPAATGDAMTLASGERTSIATAMLDMSDAIETGITVRKALRAIGAALAGVLSGAAGTTITIKAINDSSTTRVTATVDSDGNRSSIVLNL